MGHSAGCHIAGMMTGTDWTKLAGNLPADLIKGGIPVSPPIEPEPLRFASLNDALGMDAAEAKSQSPMNHPPVTDALQLVVCGEREAAEFHRQPEIYAEAFATDARPIERYVMQDCDHFDEPKVLARVGSEFFSKSMRL